MNIRQILVSFLCSLILFVGPVWAERDSDSSRLDVQRVHNWKALSDRQLVIEGSGKRKYLAELFGTCFGLRSAETIAFKTTGGNHIDSFASVVLRDGTRCPFKTFIELPDTYGMDAEPVAIEKVQTPE